MNDKAKKRWQILAKVIKSKAPVTETTKRKFQTYNLIQTELVQVSDCCHQTKSENVQLLEVDVAKPSSLSENVQLLEVDVAKPSSKSENVQHLEVDVVKLSSKSENVQLLEVDVDKPLSKSDDIELTSICRHTWHRVHCCLLPNLHIQVRLFKNSVSLSDLVGFNNTGNVCIWPSEECLAYYCLENRTQFSGSRVLEVGGGMTCLAGLLLAKTNVAKQVHLTDGNSNAANNLQDMLQGDKVNLGGGSTEVTASMLRWDDVEAVEHLKNSFDWIICADCLFFDSGREGLVTAIQQLLTPDGVALIVAPNRGGTFTQFENSARRLFDVQVQTKYSPTIWEAHQRWLEDPAYQTDIHYPKLMMLSNKSCS